MEDEAPRAADDRGHAGGRGSSMGLGSAASRCFLDAPPAPGVTPLPASAPVLAAGELGASHTEDSSDFAGSGTR